MYFYSAAESFTGVAVAADEVSGENDQEAEGGEARARAEQPRPRSPKRAKALLQWTKGKPPAAMETPTAAVDIEVQ